MREVAGELLAGERGHVIAVERNRVHTLDFSSGGPTKSVPPPTGSSRRVDLDRSARTGCSRSKTYEIIDAWADSNFTVYIDEKHRQLVRFPAELAVYNLRGLILRLCWLGGRDSSTFAKATADKNPDTLVQSGRKPRR
jgi:hypothetical protein